MATQRADFEAEREAMAAEKAAMAAVATEREAMAAEKEAMATIAAAVAATEREAEMEEVALEWSSAQESVGSSVESVPPTGDESCESSARVPSPAVQPAALANPSPERVQSPVVSPVASRTVSPSPAEQQPVEPRTPPHTAEPPPQTERSGSGSRDGSPVRPQYRTPAPGGGQPQKAGLLRRWGFLFRAPK